MQDNNEKLFAEFFPEALRLLEQGNSAEQIEKKLLEKIDDIVFVTMVLKEAKNAYYDGLRTQGFRLVLTGCLTGLSGFLITFINFNTSRSIDLAMYGLTTLGITIVFWGIFKIIG